MCSRYLTSTQAVELFSWWRSLSVLLLVGFTVRIDFTGQPQINFSWRFCQIKDDRTWLVFVERHFRQTRIIVKILLLRPDSGEN